MAKVELLFTMLFLGLKEEEKGTSSVQIRKILLNAPNFYFNMASM
jgi:hypothetical protein